MPTALERSGRLLADAHHERRPFSRSSTRSPASRSRNNVIPAAIASARWSAMLSLLPKPNGILNPAAGQQWTSNSAYDLTPVHGRTNNVLRMDAVFTDKTRASVQAHQGPGRRLELEPLHAGHRLRQPEHARACCRVLDDHAGAQADDRQRDRTSATRTTAGASRPADDFDYTTLYRSDARHRSAAVRAVRRLLGSAEDLGIRRQQVDEWPYAPRFATSRRQPRRAGRVTRYSGDEPLPRLNLSGRFYFSDDLSITRGRHNFKMGVSLEYNRKTEPGSADYMGNFNFGHDANNPLSTGNGYANMLLGVFTTYTELTSRVDRDVRHWQNDFYFQDNWRVTPRLTVDLGVRVQHSGSDFEVNNMNSGFFTDQWQREPGGARVPAGLHDRRARQPGLRGGQPAGDRSGQPERLLPDRVHRQHRAGLGQAAQRDHHRRHGRAEGRAPTSRSRTSSAAPRAGMAWNVTGDGKTALRASWGIFYNFPRSTGDGGYPFSGGCPVSCTRQIRWATVRRHHRGATADQPDREPGQRRPSAATSSRSRSRTTSTSRSSATSASTPSAEIAWVGNYTWNHGRIVDDNRLPLYVYGNPANLVNNAPHRGQLAALSYGQYPGMGSVNRLRARRSTPRRCSTTRMQLQRRSAA